MRITYTVNKNAYPLSKNSLCDLIRSLIKIGKGRVKYMSQLALYLEADINILIYCLYIVHVAINPLDSTIIQPLILLEDHRKIGHISFWNSSTLCRLLFSNVGILQRK